jgi:hypothetical protein
MAKGVFSPDIDAFRDVWLKLRNIPDVRDYRNDTARKTNITRLNTYRGVILID